MSVTKNDEIVSLSHEIARAALQKYEGNDYNYRWLQSKTKVRTMNDNVFVVRIRAKIAFTPGKPGGSWITISTTVVKRDEYNYFPGEKVTLDLFPNIPKETYDIMSFEGGYRHLQYFEIAESD